MRILNLQEFVNDQTNLFRERRTSQYTRFLDKSVNFVTYYSVNRVISTESINDRAVDSYIGSDSSVRYNKISNLPVYGFPIIDTANDYSDEGGFTNDFTGSIIMLPNIIEPSEGDCFVLNIFSEFQFFRIVSVEQTVMRSKPHYVCQFIVGIPDQLNQLNKQVAEEYNAIFDNIGTQDRVVISNNEYNLRKEYEKIYFDILDYYMNSFYKSKLSMFNIAAPMKIRDDNNINFTEKYLIRFMRENRIIIFDTVARNIFTLDYNHLDGDQDYLSYKKTIYWAIENKDMSKFLASKYIICKKIASPFTLVKGETQDEFFKSDSFSETEPTPYENQFYIDYDFSPLWKKWIEKDVYSTPDDCYDKVLSIIVSYLRGNIMMPGYFQNIIGEMNPMHEYIYLPIILYIIRSNIHGLMNTKITI